MPPSLSPTSKCGTPHALVTLRAWECCDPVDGWRPLTSLGPWVTSPVRCVSVCGQAKCASKSVEQLAHSVSGVWAAREGRSTLTLAAPR